DGIRAFHVTGVQTCALPISTRRPTTSCPAPPSPVNPDRAPPWPASPVRAPPLARQPGPSAPLARQPGPSAPLGPPTRPYARPAKIGRASGRVRVDRGALGGQ